MRRLMAFVLTSAVVGLLTAALLAPLVGAAQVAVGGSMRFFESLPDTLEAPPAAQRSTIHYADGSPMATFFEQNRVLVPLSAMGPVLPKAVIAIEDARFYEHGGVDTPGVVRALLNNLRGGETQGASTITQQWVKNVLAEEARRQGGEEAYLRAVSENYGRKVREIRLATAVEERLSKDQILESYLNLVLFGNGNYGAEAAAQHYFSKSAAELTLPEAALLAGMIQSPVDYEPAQNPEAARARRDLVLRRMLELGFIDRVEYKAAVAVPLEATLRIRETPNGCQQAGSAAFFCDFAIRTVLLDPAFGATEPERRDLLYRGGLKITTTLERARQDAAAAAVGGAMAPTDAAGAALVSMDPTNGRVVAMAQSRGYDPREQPPPGSTAINYAVDVAMGGGSGFQTGSSFKPVTLATWLAAGRNLSEVVAAPGTASIDYAELRSSCGRLVADESWVVGNNEGEGQGEISVLEGTFRSVNTAYAHMLRQLDLCAIYGTAGALGIHRADGAEMPVYPSFILGTEEVAPLTMANAYGTFATSGVRCTPIAVLSVQDAAGQVVGGQQPQCQQVIPPNIADTVTFALAHTLDQGTARCCDIAWPAAGKTGTTNSSSETWFVGYTRQLVTAVWVGTPDEQPASLDGITLHGRQYPRLYGSTVAAPTWRAYMEQAMAGLPAVGFPARDPALVQPPQPPPE